MNFFSHSFFDERITRSQNDASAIAFRVLLLLLIPIVVIFEKFGESSVEHYLIIGAVAIATIVESIISYEKGVENPDIEEEILRIQLSAKSKRFHAYTIFARAYTSSWIMVYLYDFDKPFASNLVGILLIALTTIGTYPHPKNWLYRKVFMSSKLKNRLEEGA